MVENSPTITAISIGMNKVIMQNNEMLNFSEGMLTEDDIYLAYTWCYFRFRTMIHLKMEAENMGSLRP